MNKKVRFISTFLILGAFALSGCSDKVAETKEEKETTEAVVESSSETSAALTVPTDEIVLPEASKVLKVMDEDVLLRTEGYDADNRKIFETEYEGGNLISEKFYEYNEYGEVSKKVEKTYGLYNGELTTIYEFDYDGYLVGEQSVGKYTGEGVLPYDSEITVEYIYDFGQLAKTVTVRTDYEADTYVTTTSKTFEYVNDKLVSETEYEVGDDGSETYLNKIEYTYDDDGHIIEKSLYHGGTEPTEVSTYEYSDGVIVGEHVIYGDVEKDYTYVYEAQ